LGSSQPTVHSHVAERASSSLGLQPTSRVSRKQPAATRAAPSLRFLASPRHPRRRSARRSECQPAAAFRPQVFSTSRRFAPHVASRACFIPQARPGFTLQGLLLPGSRAASRRSLPSCRYRLAPAASRALLPPRVRCPPAAGEGVGGSMPSWGSSSPGSSLSRPQATLPPPSPHALRRHPYETDVHLRHRVSAHREPGSSLARPPTLLRSMASSNRSPVQSRDRTGLIFSPQGRSRVAALPYAR